MLLKVLKQNYIIGYKLRTQLRVFKISIPISIENELKHMKRKVKNTVIIEVNPFDIVCKVFTDKLLMILFVKKLHKQDITDDIVQSQGMILTICNEEGETYHYMYLPKYYDDIVVAHEVLHLTYEVFKLTGTEINYNNHEMQTHLQGYLMKQIKEKVYGIKG